MIPYRGAGTHTTHHRVAKNRYFLRISEKKINYIKVKLKKFAMKSKVWPRSEYF